MKKIFFNTAFVLLLVLILTNCDKKEDRYPFTPAAGLSIKSSVTELDTKVLISLSATNLNCKQVVLSAGDSYEETVTLTQYTPEGENAEMRLVNHPVETSVLNIENVGDRVVLNATAQIESHAFYKHSISVASSFDVSLPVVEAYDSIYKVKWNITPAIATVDRVDATMKVGKDGTAFSIGNTATGEYGINGADYAVNDTLFVKIDAFAGERTSVFKDQIIVVAKE